MKYWKRVEYNYDGEYRFTSILSRSVGFDYQPDEQFLGTAYEIVPWKDVSRVIHGKDVKSIVRVTWKIYFRNKERFPLTSD